MEVLLSLALLVCLASIGVFFSQEFAGVFKKFFSIPGMKLLVPLILASFLIEYYEDWGLWLLLWCKEGLHDVVHLLSDYIPTDTGSLFYAHILQLFLMASLPVWFLLVFAKTRKRYEPWPNTDLVGLVLWLIASILLTVYRP